MSRILDWLSMGDLRSDGLSDEVVKIVIQRPDLITDLIEGLDHSEDVIRGHTADALEKVGRSRPELLLRYLPNLISCSEQDSLAMVKMHLAMLFGHLAIFEEQVEELVSALLKLLHDESVFAASWAITSLCIIGRKYPGQRDLILQQIVALRWLDSAAIRSKVRKAIHLLTDENVPFPKGWIKSEHLSSWVG